MNILIISIVSMLTFSVMVCDITAKVLFVLTIIGAICWLLNAFAISGTTVLWLFASTFTCVLYVLISQIFIILISEFGGINGADN